MAIYFCCNKCSGTFDPAFTYCPVCDGETQDELTTLRTRVAELEKERDELLAALKKLTDVFANIGITSGLYDDEQDALKSACAAIASAEGKAE